MEALLSKTTDSPSSTTTMNNNEEENHATTNNIIHDDIVIDDNDQDVDQNIKILVVDDDHVTRTVLKKLLKNLGYEAHTASGGRKALEQLLRLEFDLMLVDVMMPEMDGFSLIRVFKQASSKEIPCIMMSGSEDPETLAKCFQCGAEDFLPKPIKEEILKARIQKCLAYRKRKLREKYYKELLNEEKRLKKELTEQRDRNNEQLEEFKKKVSDTIETPLQVVMETISDLMNGKYESEQYKVALITIMKSLSSSALYRPAFVDYVQNANMEDSIRDWLVNQYSKDGEDGIFHDSGVAKRRKSKSETRKSSIPTTQITEDILPFDLDTYVPELKNDSSMNSTNYSCFEYHEDDLKKHVMHMFKQLDLYEKFNFRPIKLWNLLEALRSRYKKNHYHNFIHAIDVTQYVFIFISSDKIKEMLTLEEKFMILTAALCHDVDHPGVNNNFLINTQDELALLYNDRSVLENHHAAYAFKLLNDPRYNILEGIDDEFYKEFRRTVVNIILATDMASHFSICSKFQARISTGPLLNDAIEDRMLLLKIIMKCADINNISRPFPIAKEWAELCIKEFLQQGDKEKERNIPVSPLMDRDTLNFPKSQIGFADFVAAPLFKHVATAFSNLTYMHNSIMYNRDQWQIIYDDAEKRSRTTSETADTAVVSGDSTTSDSIAPMSQLTSQTSTSTEKDDEADDLISPSTPSTMRDKETELNPTETGVGSTGEHSEEASSLSGTVNNIRPPKVKQVASPQIPMLFIVSLAFLIAAICALYFQGRYASA